MVSQMNFTLCSLPISTYHILLGILWWIKGEICCKNRNRKTSKACIYFLLVKKRFLASLSLKSYVWLRPVGTYFTYWYKVYLLRSLIFYLLSACSTQRYWVAGCGGTISCHLREALLGNFHLFKPIGLGGSNYNLLYSLFFSLSSYDPFFFLLQLRLNLTNQTDRILGPFQVWLSQSDSFDEKAVLVNGLQMMVRHKNG